METNTDPQSIDTVDAVAADNPPHPNLPPWVTVGIVGVLLILSGGLSFTAAIGKSATYDEPLHAVGGMVHHYRNDYRINPEDPALFGWWASLPHSRDAIPLNEGSVYFDGALVDLNQQWFYVVGCLYAHGGAAADTFLASSRAMFILLGIALGALVALWAYKLAGGWAAVGAASLFCLDPNFLAHSALVKNDVPLALMMCMLAFSLWRFGHSGGWYWLLAAAVACGLAVNIKFSGVLFAPMFVALVAIRAMMSTPIQISHVVLDTRWKRAIIAVGGTAVAILVTVGITWMVYGFRYNATADGTPLATQKYVTMSVANQVRAEFVKANRTDATLSELQSAAQTRWERGNIAMPVRVDLWMQAHHILPEGWLFGFLYTYTTTLIRSAYLLGHVRNVGWWYYFPLAIIFKTPTATLLSVIIVPLAGGYSLLSAKARRAVRRSPQERSARVWAVIGLAVVPLIYFAAALTTNLNLGLRHILPVYPFLFVALGVGFARLLRRNAIITFTVAGVIVLGLLVETVVAYPNYLAFFNAPSGGARGGIRLLGDSNLDWGQDLPALAHWQKQHPGEPLYLAYFGTPNPAAYGIEYVNLTGGWPFGPTTGNVPSPGTMALSATNVQGIYWPAQLVADYLTALDPETARRLQSMPPGDARDSAFAEALRRVEPREILNGTLYLYDVPPKRSY